MKKINSTLLIVILLFVLMSCTNQLTVTFDYQDTNENLVILVTNGETVNIPDEPIKENYLFLGWFEDLNSAQSFDFSKPVEKDLTLYAKFSSYEIGKENYYVFKENNQYGLMLPDQTIVVEAIYDDALPYQYGLAFVLKNQMFSYIDLNGNPVIPFQPFNPFYKHDDAVSENGFIKVLQDGVTTVYDREGDLQFQTSKRISTFDYFSDGRIPAMLYENDELVLNSCVYLDEQGDIVLDDQYESCTSFSNGIAFVLKDQIYYGINPEGDVLFSNQYTKVYELNGGHRFVYNKDGVSMMRSMILGDTPLQEYQHINGTSNQSQTIGLDLTPVDLCYNRIIYRNLSNQLFIFNLNFEQITEAFYTSGLTQPGCFDGMLNVKNDQQQYGAVDVLSGMLVIEYQYEALYPFIDGLAVAKKDGLYGVIDKNNQVIIPFIYEELIPRFTSTFN